MARSASQTIQFFLGIGGNQTGPFTDEEVNEQIRQGAVPVDALIWYEGLPDWQPIQSVDYFKETFTGGGPTPSQAKKSTTTPGGFKPLDEGDDDEGESADEEAPKKKNKEDAFVPIQTGKKKKKKESGAGDSYSTYASNDRVATVFSDDGDFHAGGGGKKRGLLLLAMLVLVGGAGGYLYSTGEFKSLLGMAETPFATPTPKEAVKDGSTREVRARQALSQLLLKPDESIRTLTEVAREKPEDSIAAEAIKSLVEYYKQRKRHGDAGRLLMETKHPREASEFFLMEPPSYEEAEPALFSAYSVSQDPGRRELLLKDINLLLGPLKNIPTAVERIRLLEKDFPNDRHPYGYYLKTTDQKISDLFSRLSFHFVQGLLGHLMSEMPQINFISRPIVEIKKDKKDGYRIVGSYKGEVGLNQDRMKGIYFTFWLFNEQWAVVDTNLTVERERFSKAERKRREGEVLSADKMLSYMEETFKTLFPSSALHELVSVEKMAGKKKTE